LAGRRVRTDLSWRRALESAADSREAQPKEGRSLAADQPCGIRRDVAQAGGGLQPEESHDLAVEVPLIDCCR
jgi:hypothetical protein